ncbi:MAG: hypothetical protein AB4911_21010 [Oscillochloridaceae bacterium umkhey_bin13]
MATICILAAHQHLRDALTFNIQTQSQGHLVVVGQASSSPAELMACAAQAPDVIVIAIGIETGNDLRALAHIRQLSPHSRILAVDTVGAEAIWPGGWEGVDAVLCSEQLSAELIPTLMRLAGSKPS